MILASFSKPVRHTETIHQTILETLVKRWYNNRWVGVWKMGGCLEERSAQIPGNSKTRPIQWEKRRFAHVVLRSIFIAIYLKKLSLGRNTISGSVKQCCIGHFKAVPFWHQCHCSNCQALMSVQLEFQSSLRITVLFDTTLWLNRHYDVAINYQRDRYVVVSKTKTVDYIFSDAHFCKPRNLYAKLNR